MNIKSTLALKTVFVLTIVLSAFECGTAKIKVACVGNSITFGALIPNRENNCYPAQLQAYLGDDYEVKNFGVSGSTLLSKGDYPYRTTREFQQSKEYNPDIVLIKLGTNDSKPQNRRFFDDFMADYQSMIDSYRNLSSKPKIILITPIRCFLPKGSEIDSAFISERIVPSVRQIAYINGLETLNLHNIFGDKWISHIVPDKIHPSSIGAGRIARAIGEYLTGKTAVQPVIPNFIGSEARKFNFHGYDGYDFSIDGLSCKMVLPRFEASGKPWVLRARFWGHQPQTDISLLEHGFHILYCDVADLYGAPEAVNRWNRFYDLLQEYGFNKKAVLEGMSRGGLIVYNWATANPDKVACIYADAPVMSLSSWPMGLGNSYGSETDTQNMMKAYQFCDTADVMRYSKEHIAEIAAAMAATDIPILHVVGDADKVVPLAENTALFEAEMQKRGRTLKIVHKPGVGHHPHSLPDPEAIVNFILSSTTGRQNMCVHPVPGNEFREGAGWASGYEWHLVADDIRNTLNGKKLKLLLLGNSITQGWGGSRVSVTYKPGKDIMDKACGKGKWESAGISGDKTQNLLWRLKNHNYSSCRPKNVVIAIGINNLIASDDPKDTAKGIIAVTEEAEKIFPKSRIILLGLYPSGKDKDSAIRKKCDKIHDFLGNHKFAKAIYTNPTGWFTDENGDISDGLYAGDYIHFTPEGYRIATQKILRLMR